MIPPAHALRDDPEKPAEDRSRRTEASLGEGDGSALIVCAGCANTITTKSAFFTAPGRDAPAGLFANPSGAVFEVVTVRTATGIFVMGTPTSDATWFRGYAWRVVLCARCGAHLGWSYGAVLPTAAPATFFGLIATAIREAPGPAGAP